MVISSTVSTWLQAGTESFIHIRQTPRSKYNTASPIHGQTQTPSLLSEPIIHTTNPVRQISTSYRVQARSRTSVNLFAESFVRDAGPSSRNLYRSSALSPGILPFLFPFDMSMLSAFQAPGFGHESSSSLSLTLISRGTGERVDAGDVERELATLS